MTTPGFRSPGTAARDRAVTVRNLLAGAGVPATLEPGDLEPPGAWVRVATMRPETLDEAWEVRLQVYLVAPDVGALEAWDLLAPMLDRVLTVLEPDESVNTATSVVLPHTSTPLPAFSLVVDELVDT